MECACQRSTRGLRPDVQAGLAVDRILEHPQLGSSIGQQTATRTGPGTCAALPPGCWCWQGRRRPGRRRLAVAGRAAGGGGRPPSRRLASSGLCDASGDARVIDSTHTHTHTLTHTHTHTHTHAHTHNRILWCRGWRCKRTAVCRCRRRTGTGQGDDRRRLAASPSATTARRGGVDERSWCRPLTMHKTKKKVVRTAHHQSPRLLPPPRFSPQRRRQSNQSNS